MSDGLLNRVIFYYKIAALQLSLITSLSKWFSKHRILER